MRRVLILLIILANNVSASENLSDDEQYCTENAALSCADYLQQQLATLPRYSHAWYRVKAFQLNNFYDQHQFSVLHSEAATLIAQDSRSDGSAEVMPTVLKVQVYFYYAKTLFHTGHTAEAKDYANRAAVILQDIYTAFGNPLRLVELANLQYSLGQLEQADRLLTQAQHSYQKSKDPLFLFELYSNKALISHQRNNLEEAATYRNEALNAAMTLGHHQKMIVAMGNLARTQQLLGRLPAALNLYEQSLRYTANPEYRTQHHIHLVRLAEICTQLQDYAAAQGFYAQIDVEVLSPAHQQLYHEISSKLAIALQH